MWGARECAGSAFISISGVHCSALGVHLFAYLECVGGHFSALGVCSLAYLECIHLHMRSALECMHLSLRFASGWYQYKHNYEIEKNINYSLNSYRERSVHCQTKTLNYWFCASMFSFATLSAHFQTDRWLDWLKTCWVNPLGWGWVVTSCWIITISWPLIGRAVSMDCKWIADGIDLKLDFWACSTEFQFLAFDWFSCFHAFAYKLLDGLTSSLVNELIRIRI